MITSVFSGKNPTCLTLSGRAWFLYLAYSFVLCLGFAWMGFPKPHVDDPWYVGTAEHLARTGDLYNPYIRNWMSILTPGKYFAQFPFYPFLLAGWMKVAGTGTTSVLAFFLVIHFLCCLFSGWFLRRANLPAIVGLFLPWMILSLSQTQGFRGDIPGLCFFWMSAVCITYSRLWTSFAAALSGSLAVLLWPVLLGYLFPVVAVYLFMHWKDRPTQKSFGWIVGQFLALTAGGLTAVLAFLWMIDFEWSLFLHDFTRVTEMRRPEGNSILHAFLGLSWARYNHSFLLSVFLLSLFLIYWTLRPSPFLSKPTRLWVIETLSGSALAILLYAVNTQLTYFFFWLVFFVAVADFVRAKAKKEIAVILLLSFGLWIQTYDGIKNFLPRPAVATTEAENALHDHPNSVVVFDEIAYRYLFDLRPPAGSLAWLCLRPGPDLGATLADKKPEQLWIVAEKRLEPELKPASDKLVVIP